MSSRRSSANASQACSQLVRRACAAAPAWCSMRASCIVSVDAPDTRPPRAHVFEHGARDRQPSTPRCCSKRRSSDCDHRRAQQLRHLRQREPLGAAAMPAGRRHAAQQLPRAIDDRKRSRSPARAAGRSPRHQREKPRPRVPRRSRTRARPPARARTAGAAQSAGVPRPRAAVGVVSCLPSCGKLPAKTSECAPRRRDLRLQRARRFTRNAQPIWPTPGDAGSPVGWRAVRNRGRARVGRARRTSRSAHPRRACAASPRTQRRRRHARGRARAARRHAPRSQPRASRPISNCCPASAEPRPAHRRRSRGARRLQPASTRCCACAASARARSSDCAACWSQSSGAQQGRARLPQRRLPLSDRTSTSRTRSPPDRADRARARRQHVQRARRPRVRSRARSSSRAPSTACTAGSTCTSPPRKRPSASTPKPKYGTTSTTSIRYRARRRSAARAVALSAGCNAYETRPRNVHGPAQARCWRRRRRARRSPAANRTPRSRNRRRRRT